MCAVAILCMVNERDGLGVGGSGSLWWANRLPVSTVVFPHRSRYRSHLLYYERFGLRVVDGVLFSPRAFTWQDDVVAPQCLVQRTKVQYC